MKNILISFLLLCFFMLSCKKEEGAMENVPSISLEQAGPKTIKADSDSIFFKIAYTDGDGDLGSTNPEEYNLFVKDSRISLEYKFRINDLVPGDGAIPIKGTLSFSINNTILTGNGTEEQVVYTIYIKDRSGNISNSVQTEGLRVVK